MASPRVLLEIADRELGIAVERTIRGQGYEVVVCQGPGSLPGGRCPLVEGLGCPFGDAADVIIHALAEPFAPTVVVCSAGRRYGAPARPVQKIVSGPLTPEALVVTISSVLSRAHLSSP
jgi:hypothetical protein